MITVTPEAKEKIAEMCVENAMIGVRAFVHGTGCAGMSHSMTFVEDKGKERYMEIAPYVYIDPVAYQFMDECHYTL